MSIFGSILSKIMGRKAEASQPGATAPVADEQVKPTASEIPAGSAAAPNPAPTTPPAPGGAMASGAAAATSDAAPISAEPVDVEAVLSEMASKNGQSLNWRQSIVDLMKLLELDSSLQNRKELAKELGYSGNMDDSASMNIWLHKQVMRKLAENGGKVPADLKD
ncbi:hypothetical protein CR162_00095 [Pseudoroseomonas rhizosphaerae]|uniref:DUF3597 domain-containing protein n=1 Tax=Teichococcus rhizosphaerae TaxID=1335062 RepID=A0A2C7AH53_9PROT|nr:DUF3597 domain-containing protein [Pseudoroseomonas rhizosphaerae]PHK96815.1 hypothetical protein CR162_00095 [Pseudoroseomonas rhizosphaerae]